MRVSSEIGVGLKRVGNSSLLNEETFEKLLNEISSYLEFSLNSNHVVDFPPGTPKLDVIKECYASILTFLVEGIRWNEEPYRLEEALREYKISEDRIERILGVYTKQKLPLRLSLKTFNSDPPKIIDVTWKMQHCVKSSFSDFDGKLLYFIQLTVSKKNKYGENEKINFACSVNQLQSLVATLRAATRHLESIAER